MTIETALKAITIDSRSEEHTSELQSRPHISYAVFCLKKKKHQIDLKDNVVNAVVCKLTSNKTIMNELFIFD